VSADKVSVTVRIAGEEHTIRSSAEAEYTKRCARYVDKRIHDIKKQVGLLEGHKAAILAALSITDEFFQAKEDLEQRGVDLASKIDGLAEALEAAVAAE
jgi:cell division protein ZapA (FtsZ GTPase activity inhibitor)